MNSNEIDKPNYGWLKDLRILPIRAKYIYVLLVTFPYFGYGETCDTPSLNKRIESADYIFSGKVVSRKKDTSNSIYATDHILCGAKTAEIEVFQTWKGILENKVKVFSWDACNSLGTYFAEGEQYLIYAKHGNKNSDEIVDVGACYTELLIESVRNRSVFKLNKKYKKETKFDNSELVGVWLSYGNSLDRPFQNVDQVVFQFKKRYKFVAKTFKKEKITKYKGNYYAKSGQFSLYDQDGPQDFIYKIQNEELVFETRDGEIKYHLKQSAKTAPW